MQVRPVLLTDEIKQILAPSYALANFDWQEIEQAIATYAACVWQVGNCAWIVTLVNADDEIEILLCGGSGALSCAKPFEDAMRAIPEHKGMTFRLEGRRAWKRVFRNWNCEELAGDKVLLTKKV